LLRDGLWRSYAARLCSTSILYANVPISPVQPQMAADQAKGDQVMLTTANGLRGPANPRGHVPTKATRAAALLGILIFVSIAVNALIIVADGSLRQPAPIAELAR
jgi:hypothetical protein